MFDPILVQYGRNRIWLIGTTSTIHSIAAWFYAAPSISAENSSHLYEVNESMEVRLVAVVDDFLNGGRTSSLLPPLGNCNSGLLDFLVIIAFFSLNIIHALTPMRVTAKEDMYTTYAMP